MNDLLFINIDNAGIFIIFPSARTVLESGLVAVENDLFFLAIFPPCPLEHAGKQPVIQIIFIACPGLCRLPDKALAIILDITD